MKKICIFLFFIITVFSISACAETTTSIAQTTNTTSALTTVTTERMLVTKDVSQYVTYNFSSDITLEEQESLIEGNEVNLQYLLMRDLHNDNHIEYFISRDSDNVYAEKNHRIFLDLDEYNSVEAIFCMVQAFNSKYANYGLMYGLANYIAAKLAYESTDLQYTPSEVLDYLKREENELLFDITFPCFYSEYSSQRQMDNASEFSIYITKFIIENNSIYILDDLLKETDLSLFEAEFTEHKNQWFSSLSSNFQVNASSYPKAFSTEHLYNTLEWITESCEYELRDGYFYDLGLDYYSLNQSYATLVNGINAMEEDMDIIDKMLKDENYDYPELHIILDPSCGRSWYNLTGDVLVGDYSAFLHEYVHYLTMQIMDTYATRIMYEWVACYYSNYSIFLEKSITEYLETEYINNTENSVLNKLGLENIGDFNYSEDWQETIHYLQAYYQDYTVLSIDHYVRLPLTSYVLYLIDICGSEEAFFEIMKDNSLLENYTSKTFEELAEDWVIYHQETFVLS